METKETKETQVERKLGPTGGGDLQDVKYDVFETRIPAEADQYLD